MLFNLVTTKASLCHDFTGILVLYAKQLYLLVPLLLQFEFSPQTLCCYGKQLCTIQRDAAYFSYQNR